MFCYEASQLVAEFAARGYSLVETFEGVTFWEIPGKAQPIMVAIGADGHCFADHVDYVLDRLGEPPLRLPQIMCP